MGKLTQQFAEKMRPKLIYCFDYALRVQRIDPSKLAAWGWVLLEANQALKGAMDEIKQIERQTASDLRAIPDKERDKKMALFHERTQEVRRRRTEAFLSNPESEAAYVERCTKYIVACVTGIGQFNPEARQKFKAMQDAGKGLPLGYPLDGDIDPASMFVDCRKETEVADDIEPYYIEDLQFVLTPEEADKEEGSRVWIHGFWPPWLRMTLGATFIDLQGVIDALVPFRFGSEDGADSGSGGEALRTEAQPTGRNRSERRASARTGDRSVGGKGGTTKGPRKNRD